MPARINVSTGYVNTDGDFALRVAKGAIPHHSVAYRFGCNMSVGVTFETFWPPGGVYEFPAAPLTMTVSSTSADDNANGTGARTVFIEGLDENFRVATITVALDGLTPVTLPIDLVRVNQAFVEDVGASDENAGVIAVGSGTVTAGVPDKTYGHIGIGDGQTLQAVYTIPDGQVGFAQEFNSFASRSANENVTTRVRARPPGKAWRVVARFPLFQSNAKVTRFYPGLIPPRTDLDFQVLSGATPTEVAANVEILLVNFAAEGIDPNRTQRLDL